MEDISNAELIELAFLASDHLYSQFQFWLSITFALIVASFVAKDQLGYRVRSTLAILYLTASFLIIYRLAAAGINGTVLTEEIEQRGISWLPITVTWVGLIQMALMLFGVSAALWFLYSTYSKNDT